MKYKQLSCLPFDARSSFFVRFPVNNFNVTFNCSQSKTWKPMRASGVQINFNEWPIHSLCSITFFHSISNNTKTDSWAFVAFLDPFEAP